MARASNHPSAWGEVLRAMDKGDFKTARKLAFKYRFVKDELILTGKLTRRLPKCSN